MSNLHTATQKRRVNAVGVVSLLRVKLFEREVSYLRAYKGEVKTCGTEQKFRVFLNKCCTARKTLLLNMT